MTAVKLTVNGKDVWCHCSTRGSTTKYRRLLSKVQRTNDVEVEHFEWEQVVGTPVDGARPWNRLQLLKLPGTSEERISLEHKDAWKKIFEMLNAGAEPSSGEGDRPEVPITALRERYEVTTAREYIPWVSSDTSLSELTGLWQQSTSSFKDYDNSDEGFVNEEDKRSPPPSVSSLVACNSGIQVAAYLRWRLSEASGLAEGCAPWRYVGYEVSPRRTTRSVFSDGRKARKSGGGGIDVLLVDADGDPVVGEVKVAQDGNLGYALIQSLTYAAELVSPAQRERLAKHYPEHGFRQDGGGVSIVLLIVNREAKDPSKEPAIRLIEKINEQAGMGFPGLKRITVLKNEGEEWEVLCG
jgi:hypothetical protein